MTLDFARDWRSGYFGSVNAAFRVTCVSVPNISAACCSLSTYRGSMGNNLPERGCPQPQQPRICEHAAAADSRAPLKLEKHAQFVHEGGCVSGMPGLHEAPLGVRSEDPLVFQ